MDPYDDLQRFKHNALQTHVHFKEFSSQRKRNITQSTYPIFSQLNGQVRMTAGNLDEIGQEGGHHDAIFLSSVSGDSHRSSTLDEHQSSTASIFDSVSRMYDQSLPNRTALQALFDLPLNNTNLTSVASDMSTEHSTEGTANAANHNLLP